jgi:hypothetical protein
MKIPLWRKKASERMKKYNASLTAGQMAIRNSKAGKSSWESRTPEEKAQHLANMRASRK